MRILVFSGATKNPFGWVSVFAAGAIVACGNREAQNRAAAATAFRAATCPPASVEPVGWKRQTAERVPIDITMPPGSTRIPNDSAETWRTPSGTVSYLVTSRDPSWLDTLKGSGLCEETIDGRGAHIEYSYGNRAFGRGHYLLAFWRLSENSELDLVAFSQSSEGRDTLWAVVRSVRFR